MKRLWQVIDRERRKEGLTGKQMAHRLGMDPAHLSRLRTGQLRDLSAETLSHLIAGLGRSRILRAELLTAYLSDKLDAGGPVISEAAGKAAESLSVLEEAPQYGLDMPSTILAAWMRAGLDRRTAAALGELAKQAPTNRRLQKLLISLAEYSRKE